MVEPKLLEAFEGFFSPHFTFACYEFDLSSQRIIYNALLVQRRWSLQLFILSQNWFCPYGVQQNVSHLKVA